MMTNLPPVLRLTVFLLLSLGLHGGLAFYDWSDDLGDSGVAVAPVTVALLPAAKPMQKVAKASPEQVPAPARKALRQTVKPKAAPPATKVKKSSINNNPQAKIVEKVVTNSPASELVCPSPLETGVESSSQTVEVAPDQVKETVLMASLVTGDVQVVNKATSASLPLVEAIPRYRSNPLPEYPRIARRKHWEGVVWLLVDVSGDGDVEGLEIEKTCGHKVLDRAAERTVKRWQFSPATRGGLPVSSQVRIPVRFRLEEG
jgi:protein TonB